MEVHLPADQQSQLDDLAARTGRHPDELIEAAVAQFLARNESFRQQVQAGFDQAPRAESIGEEEMAALVEQMLEE